MAKAKEPIWRVWSEDPNTAEGQNTMFKISKQTRKDRKDVLRTNFIRRADGNVTIDPTDVHDRWSVYFEDLFNVENPNIVENTPAVLGPIEEVSVEEVLLALRCMKSGMASGPSEVTPVMFVIAGYLGTWMLCSVSTTS